MTTPSGEWGRSAARALLATADTLDVLRGKLVDARVAAKVPEVDAIVADAIARLDALRAQVALVLAGAQQ